MYTLRVWKELFRLPRLDESIAEIAPVLAPELGVGGVVVRQLDLKGGAWTTTATSKAGAWRAFPAAKSKCKPEQIGGDQFHRRGDARRTWGRHQLSRAILVEGKAANRRSYE